MANIVAGDLLLAFVMGAKRIHPTGPKSEPKQALRSYRAWSCQGGEGGEGEPSRRAGGDVMGSYHVGDEKRVVRGRQDSGEWLSGQHWGASTSTAAKRAHRVGSCAPQGPAMRVEISLATNHGRLISGNGAGGPEQV